MQVGHRSRAWFGDKFPLEVGCFGGIWVRKAPSSRTLPAPASLCAALSSQEEKVGSVFLLCGLSTGPGAWHNNCAKVQLLRFPVSSRSRNFPQIELENGAKYSHKTNLQPCGQPRATQWSYIKIFSPSSSIQTKVICQAGSITPAPAGIGAASEPSALSWPWLCCRWTDGQADGQTNGLFRGSTLQATPQLLQPRLPPSTALSPVLPLRRLLRCFSL